MGQRKNTRSCTLVGGTPYFLPHDEHERSRLALQHSLLLKAFDGKALHAPVVLGDQDLVLETGSGSGIWVQELARETVAQPRYIGTDMDPALFPCSNTLPANMKFEIHSVTDLPSEWSNKFTLVHQRLLVAGLRRRDWEQAVNEMFRVLKPGGWVQLLEFKVWTAGPYLARQLELMYRHARATGTMWKDITRCLPDFLERSGFTNIREDTRRTPMGSWAGQDGAAMKRNALAIMDALKNPVLSGGGYGIVASETDYDKLMERVKEEIDSTSGAGIEWTLFYAQKPLNANFINSKL